MSTADANTSTCNIVKIAEEKGWIIFLDDTTYLALSLGKKQKKNLDTQHRLMYAHFLRTQNALKTLTFSNVKTSAKS